jgi:hypothetical protein
MITVTALCPFHPGRYSHAIDLIRPTRVLASKPSQPISAKRWAIGFAAVITGAVWQHALKRIQRLPIGFCSANQSVPLLPVGTNIIDLIRLFALAGQISRHWEEHGKIDRPFREGLHARAILLVPTLEVRKTRAHARGNDRTAGETYEPRDMAESQARQGGAYGGVGRNTSASLYLDIPCQYSGALLKILVGLGSKNLRHRRVRR